MKNNSIDQASRRMTVSSVLNMACAAVFCLAFLFVAFERARFGVEFTDEGFYLSSVSRLSYGDRAYVDEQYTAFMSFHCVMHGLFSLFGGEMTILQMRTATVIAYMMDFGVLALVFMRFLSPAAAVFSAAPLLLFAPFPGLSSSYNTLPFAFACLSFTLLAYARCITAKTALSVMGIASGILLTVAIFSNWFYICSAVWLFLIAAFFRFRLRNPLRAVEYCCFFVFGFVVFAGAWICLSGFLPDIMSSMQHSIERSNSYYPLWKRFLWMIREFLSALRASIGGGICLGLFFSFARLSMIVRRGLRGMSTVMAALAFAILAAYRLAAPFEAPYPKLRTANAFAVLLSCVGGWLLFRVIMPRFMPSGFGSFGKGTSVLAGLSSPFRVIQLWIDRSLDASTPWSRFRNFSLLAVLCQFMVNAAITSNTGAAFSYNSMIFGGLLFSLLLADMALRMPRNRGKTNETPEKWGRLPVWAWAIFAAGIVLWISGSVFHTVYRDAPLNHLTEKIEDGSAFDGLITTRERALRLENLLSKLKGKTKRGDYLLAYNDIPTINFATETRPPTKNVWIGMGVSRVGIDEIAAKKVDYAVRTFIYPGFIGLPGDFTDDTPLSVGDGGDLISEFVDENYEYIADAYPFQILKSKQGAGQRISEFWRLSFNESSGKWEETGDAGGVDWRVSDFQWNTAGGALHGAGEAMAARMDMETENFILKAYVATRKIKGKILYWRANVDLTEADADVTLSVVDLTPDGKRTWFKKIARGFKGEASMIVMTHPESAGSEFAVTTPAPRPDGENRDILRELSLGIAQQAE